MLRKNKNPDVVFVHKRNIKGKNIFCKNCGKIKYYQIVDDENKDYCNHCYVKIIQDRLDKKKKIKTCLICKSRFHFKQKNSKYCKSCAKINTEKNRLKAVYKRTKNKKYLEEKNKLIFENKNANYKNDY